MDEEKIEEMTELREEASSEEAAAPVEEAAEADIIGEHVAEMRRRFPDVDIVKLDNNSAFRRFAGSRYGRESLAELYEAYTELVEAAEKAAEARSASKAHRATGGGSGKGGGALTGAQRAALQRWNENNPDMKMSEREFLERD